VASPSTAPGSTSSSSSPAERSEGPASRSEGPASRSEGPASRSEGEPRTAPTIGRHDEAPQHPSGPSGHGDAGGSHHDVGNAVAGERAEQRPERGYANRDDDDADDAARFWEVPSVHDQIESTWSTIVRDDDGRGPATYGWVVVLHRPGIYAAGQPAEEILKLEVRHAGPFDPVWDEAVTALTARLVRHDGSATTISRERLALALRHARYRSTASHTP
jgi:hypothetical protein